MCVSKQQPKFDESERGFTLIEVLISIVITLIVMSSVFAMLTQGQRAFQREPEIADLQQSARTVLDMARGGGGTVDHITGHAAPAPAMYPAVPVTCRFHWPPLPSACSHPMPRCSNDRRPQPRIRLRR